jgi:hypothetical protein
MAHIERKSSIRRLRKLKPHRGQDLLLQQMADTKRRIGIHMGNYLVLLEEGTFEQMAIAKQKARSELLKMGPELEKLALELGGKFTACVRDFLDSVDQILYSASNLIDQAKTVRYFHAEQKLAKILI